MTTTLITGNVWQYLTGACRTPGRRRAAISYVGVDAPTLLPLRRGDVLIVNASDNALGNHATSPEALAVYHAAGVRVFSSARLHAKLLVTTGQAVVGSANASANSTHCHEAVLITDDAAILADARAFIDGLDDCIQVDDDFLRHAQATWAKGRPTMLPGLGETRTDPGFLPPLPFRLYLTESEYYDPTDTEERAIRRASRQLRRTAGPAATYRLRSYRLRRDDRPYRRGDVLISLHRDNDDSWVTPPAVVLSDPIPIPRTRSVIYVLKERVDLHDLPLHEVQAALRLAGRRDQLHGDREIRSPALRDALLGIWGLLATP
jgi:hypothetical protein